MINVNKDFVDKYFKKAHRHPFFKESIKINQHLSFHIDGFEYDSALNNTHENPYFDILIAERRPNESPQILDYRKKIYLSKTTQPCFKVINSLKKIVKSQDWKIDYSKVTIPSKIKEYNLEDYCENGYPIFNSLESWMYSYGMQEILKDPNSLIYIEPLEWETPDNEMWKPIAKFVESKHVWDYKYGEYAVFQTDRSHSFVVRGETYTYPIQMVMTKEAIIELLPIDLENNYAINIRWKHDLGYLFCLKSGGYYKKYKHGNALYNSFINPMISGLDAVAREISDLDAEVVQHIYSTMWYISGNDCKNCKGSGMVLKDGQQMICQKCDGNGRLLKSPYKDIVLSKKMGESGIPTPPAGYVQKQTEIVRLQDERISKHIYDALASLNMEFLAQTPLNQSGISKEVDRDELNNYVYGIAYHIVENVMKPIYCMITDMRYHELVKEYEARKLMCPQINIPEKYDLLSTNTLVDNYKKAKESNLDQNIVNEIENDIINKLFSNEPETRTKLILIKSLDPLRGLSMEDKTAMLMNNAIKHEDLVVSNYITQFVNDALLENKTFADLDKAKQIEIIYKMAEAKGLDEVKKLQEEIIPTPPNEDEEQ